MNFHCLDNGNARRAEVGCNSEKNIAIVIVPAPYKRSIVHITLSERLTFRAVDEMHIPEVKSMQVEAHKWWPDLMLKTKSIDRIADRPPSAVVTAEPLYR